MPAWVTGAFAIAVFGGALGCVGLLMLKRWSTWLLLISLLAVLAQDLWAFRAEGRRRGGRPGAADRCVDPDCDPARLAGLSRPTRRAG